MDETILSCDWGTTNVRLRRVELDGGGMVDEADAAAGVKRIFDAWTMGGKDSPRDRIAHYAGALDPLLEDIGRRTSDRALVMSGMASSSIGLAELPYAPVPFRLDASDLVWREMSAPGIHVPILLLSGVRTSDDVMRGEETELIGLWASVGKSLEETSSSLFILPGTHSKHVQVEAGAIAGFRTYMTGELFELLTGRSILSGSVRTAPFDAAAFERGVLASRDRPLPSALFTARTSVLFGRLDPGENYWYLSGLLVAAELEGVAASSTRVVFCGTSRLARIYRAAIETLGFAGRTVFVEEAAARRAVVDGHLAAYRRAFT